MTKKYLSALCAIMLLIACCLCAYAADVEKSADIICTEGTYTVGNEINAGQYEVTGNSNVRVYTTDGILKTNVYLSSKSDKDGVESYVLTVNDGERVELSNDTAFKEYSPETAAPAEKPQNKADAVGPPHDGINKEKDSQGYLPVVFLSMLIPAGICIYLKFRKRI